MCRYRRRGPDRNKGSLHCQVFLLMHPNPFMNEVGIEAMGQSNIGNRDVRLCALGNDLGLEGLGIGTAFLWHGRPLKKARNGVHLNLGGHHRLKRRRQEGVLPGRLPFIDQPCRSSPTAPNNGGLIGALVALDQRIQWRNFCCGGHLPAALAWGFKFHPVHDDGPGHSRILIRPIWNLGPR